MLLPTTDIVLLKSRMLYCSVIGLLLTVQVFVYRWARRQQCILYCEKTFQSRTAKVRCILMILRLFVHM